RNKVMRIHLRKPRCAQHFRIEGPHPQKDDPHGKSGKQQNHDDEQRDDDAIAPAHQTATGAAMCGWASYPSSRKSSKVKSNRLFTSGLMCMTGSFFGSRASCLSACPRWLR